MDLLFCKFNEHEKHGLSFCKLKMFKRHALDFLQDWKKYQNNEIEMVSIHSPFFAPDPKPTITTGIKAMSASALGLLK